MRCDAVRELFSEIYDNQAEGQALLIEHIENCPECKEEYRIYTQLFDELRDLPVPELPNGFHETAMDNIRSLLPSAPLNTVKQNKRNTKTAGFAARRWAGIAAAACLLLVSIWAVRTSNISPHRQAEEFAVEPQAVLSVDVEAEHDAMYFVEDADIDWQSDQERGSRLFVPEEDGAYIDFDMAMDDLFDEADVEIEEAIEETEFGAPVAAELYVAQNLEDSEDDHILYGSNNNEIESFSWSMEIDRTTATIGAGAAYQHNEANDLLIHDQNDRNLGFIIILVVGTLLIATIIIALKVRNKTIGEEDHN